MNDYLTFEKIGIFVGIIAAFLIAGKILLVVIDRYLRKLTEKTKTILDDKLLEAFERPVYVLTIIAGSYTAFVFSFGQNQLLDTLAKISLIFTGAYLLTRITHALVSWYVEEKTARHAGSAEIASFFERLVKALIAIVFSLTTLDTLGVEVTPLIASLGIGGLAVALAFQDTLSNFFSGLYIIADRPAKVGDFIRLESGEEGYVQKIGWRNTLVKTLPNNIVIVPNSKLAQAVITNYCLPEKEMAVVIQVSVSYDSDLRRVESIVVEEARKIQQNVIGGVKNFEPFIRYHSFGDNGIGFSVILRVNEFVDKFLVTHEFMKSLHARFKKEKIEIPYPKRDIYIKEKG